MLLLSLNRYPIRVDKVRLVAKFLFSDRASASVVLLHGRILHLTGAQAKEIGKTDRMLSEVLRLVWLQPDYLRPWKLL